MKLFRRIFDKPVRQGEIIPQVRVRAAHLPGPGQLSRRNGNLHFVNNADRQLILDTAELDEIIAYGDLAITMGAMRLLSENGIHVSWLSPQGTSVLGKLTHDGPQRTLTRLLQCKAWEDEVWQTNVARAIVQAKIESMTAALRHYQRQGNRLSKGALRDLSRRSEAADEADDVKVLRGIEGGASAIWFQEYGKLFRSPFSFRVRNRRPPRDPVNALLSFGYMFLYRRVAARIEAAGFEPNLGALHEFRPGRAGMACDIMEPLRIPVVDRWVLAACNQGIVRPSEFRTEDEGVYLEHEKLPQIVSCLEQHWHQGNFDLIVADAIRNWSVSIEESTSAQTSRASAYLQRRWKRAALDEARDDESDE